MSTGSDAKDAPIFFPLELNHENMPTNRAYQDDHAEVYACCLVVMTNFLNCEEKKIKLSKGWDILRMNRTKAFVNWLIVSRVVMWSAGKV